MRRRTLLERRDSSRRLCRSPARGGPLASRSGARLPVRSRRFARPSQFEGRLLAVLDPRRSRSALGTAHGAEDRRRFVCRVRGPGRAQAVGRRGGGRGDADSAAAWSAAPANSFRVPDSSRPLEARWAWARSEAARRPGDYWVGYGLPEFSGQGDGVLSDTEGIDLSTSWTTLPGSHDVGRAGGPRRRGPARRPEDSLNRQFAVLLHVSRKQDAQGEIDRIRAQTLGLPAEIGNQPLFWLGESDDEQSIARLKRIGAAYPPRACSARSSS